MRIHISSFAMLLITLTKPSTGQTLTGSATYSALEEPFQFICRVSGSNTSSTIAFKRGSISVCTIQADPSICTQPQSSSGYTCFCESSGVLYLNITRVSLQDEAIWSCEADSQSQNNISLPVHYGPFSNITMEPSSPVIVVEGTTTAPIVRCSADCSPGCSYSWWNETARQSASRDLSLQGFRRDQGGTFTCRAINTVTSREINSQQLTVTIEWPPAEPTHDCPSSIVLGETGTCTCRTTNQGQPAGTLKWLDPANKQVSSTASSQLTLNLASIPRSNNNRNYTCSINNTHGTKTVTYTVDIKFGPVGVTITGNQQIEVHNRLTLTCKTNGPVNPAPTLTWKNSTGGSALSGTGAGTVGSPQDGGYIFSSTLTIDPRWYNNDDIIVCEGRNPGIPTEDKVTYSVVLDVTFPPPGPPIITGLPSEHINEGASLTLTCKIVGGRPLVTTVTLTCPGGYSSSGTSSEGSGTRFTTLTFTVGREWRKVPCVCSGDNPAGSYKQNYTFVKDKIYYAPDLNVSKQDADETSEAKIKCVADGNPENFIFSEFLHTWNGQFIRTVSGQKTGSQYQKQFLPSSYQDSGVYMCTVSNGIDGSNGEKQQTANISLTVHAPPKLTAGLKVRTTVGAALKDYITLSRSIFSRTSLTSYTWSKGGTNLAHGQSSQTSVELDIYGVRVHDTGYKLTLKVGPFDHLRDSGEYVLKVCNSPSRCFSSYIDLIPEGPPAAPTQFKIFKVLERAVYLTWKAEYPGGDYTQVFVVEYRLEDGDWEAYKEPLNGTEGELVTVEVSGLTEGKEYEFRVYARNTRTTNNSGEYTGSLKAVTKEKVESAPGVAGPIAGAVVCVLLAAAVGVGVFSLYRRGYRCSLAKPASQTTNEPENDRPYYENVATVPERGTDTYAKLEVKKNSSQHNYDKFTPAGKKKESTSPKIDSEDSSKTYENVAMQLYANVNVKAKTKPKIKPKPKKKDPTYANTGFLKTHGK